MYSPLRTALLISAVLALMCLPAAAATFTVNSGRDAHDALPGDGFAADADSGLVTLRSAIEEAAALSGPDTVIITSAVSPLTVTLGELTISDNRTVLIGDGTAVIDAVDNLRYSATIVLASDSNVIKGLTITRSRVEAVIAQGANNRIGDAAEDGRVIITGGGLDIGDAASILITGLTAQNNVVTNCWIGLDGNGGHVNGNRNGISVENSASGNMIGGTTTGSGNVISGNDGYGVNLEGDAHDNQIAGNYIGVDIDAMVAVPNSGTGIRLTDGAHDNIIGGTDLSQGNLIAGNGGDGILLDGPTVTQNGLNGNRIGLDGTGIFPTPNGGDGIRVSSGAHHNLIGGPYSYSGNFISGNDGSGVHIHGLGADHNVIQANWVGVQFDGFSDAGNGQIDGDGILIDGGARYNQVGGYTYDERNVASGNYGAGIHLDGVGTEENIVIGNFVGSNYTGTSSVFNDNGVEISGGARYNEIGGEANGAGNIISGNRADFFPNGAGVVIHGQGTDYNTVQGNRIGVDFTGLRALRNGSCGVIIGEGAQYNLIGGNTEAARNFISGNSSIGPIDGVAAGVHIFGTGTSYNRVTGNTLGLGLGVPPAVLQNWGHGIGLFAGASHNDIGGATYAESNHITRSQGHGIIVSGVTSRSNLIRHNQLTDNDSLGIAVRDGAQEGIVPPTITYLGPSQSGIRQVIGEGAPSGGVVDIYLVASPDPSGAGEGFAYLATGIADVSGDFDFDIATDEADPLTITAIAVDLDNNSSAFSLNATTGDPTEIGAPSDGLIPQAFELSPNYPNPFNAGTSIVFSIPSRGHTTLEICNTLGQRVTTLLDQQLSPGSYTAHWDGLDGSGAEVASGLYFYRLATADHAQTRKMLLLK